MKNPKVMEQAKDSLRQAIRRQFTKEDFDRNLRDITQDMSNEELYDLYEACFVHNELRKEGK